MRILVTGAAGFIGAALSQRLLDEGHEVLGLDNFNDYYDPVLKENRAAPLCEQQRFQLIRADLADLEALEHAFASFRPEIVVNLAAQAGVRYSLKNPHAYGRSNLTGFLNLLECCRHHLVAHLVFASSSSVYGANGKIPFSTADPVNHPVSLYAATKKANELMAHSYSHLYGIPATGLRFFTVYGPWGRPDMAPMIFTRKILAGEAIDVFNYGKHRRDFTYIDDIIEGVVRVMAKPPRGNVTWDAEHPDPASARAPWQLFNIGHNQPVELMHFISLLEQALGRKAKLNLLPMQPGDVETTFADIEPLADYIGYRPQTDIETGIGRFIRWYRNYHGAT